jgi:hypothetical protein
MSLYGEQFVRAVPVRDELLFIHQWHLPKDNHRLLLEYQRDYLQLMLRLKHHKHQQLLYS